LSEYKLTQAIDVWVDKIDPGAHRRTRNHARTRDFTVADSDATGTSRTDMRPAGDGVGRERIEHTCSIMRSMTDTDVRVDSSRMRAKWCFVASLKMRACGVPI
jgi:hypothetical protein